MYLSWTHSSIILSTWKLIVTCPGIGQGSDFDSIASLLSVWGVNIVINHSEFRFICCLSKGWHQSQWNDLAGKGTCHQVWRPEFNPLNLHNGKRNMTPPHTYHGIHTPHTCHGMHTPTHVPWNTHSTHMSWHVHSHTCAMACTLPHTCHGMHSPTHVPWHAHSHTRVSSPKIVNKCLTRRYHYSLSPRTSGKNKWAIYKELKQVSSALSAQSMYLLFCYYIELNVLRKA